MNDTLGHAVGDELIKVAARSITANLRQMDVPCRYGGDEFVLLLPHADADQAAAVADRIRRDYATASAGLLRSESGKTMSIGVAALRSTSPAPAGCEGWPRPPTPRSTRAKEAGRDRVARADRSVVRAAFTLIELLIVVVILGILAGLVIPQMAGASVNARAEAFVANLRDVGQMCQVYHQKHGALPEQGPGDPIPPALLADVGPAEFPSATPVGGSWHMGPMTVGGRTFWGVGVWWNSDPDGRIQRECEQIDAAVDDGNPAGGKFVCDEGSSRYYWVIG